MSTGPSHPAPPTHPATTVHAARFTELLPATAYHLWQLRSAIFVVEQDCPYLDLDGRDLEPQTVHLWVEAEGTPVGTLRILEDGPDGGNASSFTGTATEHIARIGRVVVAEQYRRRGLAAELMRAALERVGERTCVLDAQAHLADWYARFGFEPSGPEFLEDGIPHRPMVRPGRHP